MKTEADILYAEAVTKLEAYLKTGLEGFRQQALDRCRELGITVDCSPEHLLNHLRMSV